MGARYLVAILVDLAMVAGAGQAMAALDGPDGPYTASGSTTVETSTPGPSSPMAPTLASGYAAARQSDIAGPCALAEVTANPTRPAWDYGASTTQCGVAEVDSGWLEQPMGGDERQQMLTSSVRYGLTSKLDLRWGSTSRITQSGGGAAPLEGIGDQWASARYRFVEQGRWIPAMALLYGVKIPAANPAKGFGSGFFDEQYIFIASRDLGKNHLDFNAVGTVTGGPHGRDGAMQLGLALTRPLNARLSWILESYGGPQPGTADRFGAAFTGATFALRPRLVFDVAYSRTYTAGAPRQQVMFGSTYSLRPGFAHVPRSSFFGRLFGR
jgi:hypothetical protein